MATVSKFGSLLLALWVLCFALPATGGARYLTEATPAAQQSGNGQVRNPDSRADIPQEEDAAEEELAPAAVQLDVTNLPPLLQELYQATRETKEQEVLARLAHVKQLVEGGADLKATDTQGRTALHWAIFGSSYNVKPRVLVAYEEIADAMIQRGVEINRGRLSGHRSRLPALLPEF